MRITGFGTRVLNFLVDTTLIGILSIILFQVWNWYVKFYGYGYHNYWWFFFGFLVVYYTVFETFFARTPGKWVTYSRVVKKDGKRAGFPTIFLRSLSRVIIIDMFFIPFLDKTLHDYISGTEVVDA